MINNSAVKKKRDHKFKEGSEETDKESKQKEDCGS
jgi:hypothetical protein